MSHESKPIAYERHPVSRERKRELVAAGFRILDIKFAPPAARTPVEPVEPPVEAAVEVVPEEVSELTPTRRGRRRKTDVEAEE